MRVRVVAVGRPKGDAAALIAEYERRAARYWKFDALHVDGGGGRGTDGPDQVMAAEAERLLSRVPDGFEIVAMTREGKGMSSTELSKYLGEHALRSSPGVAFLIGGAHGLGPEVLRKARRRLSLSSMTLPHDLARMVLAEQIYRAGTIQRGEPYHKG